MLPWCTLYQGASVTGTLGNLTSIRLCLLCIRWMDRFALCGVKGQPNSFTIQYIIWWIHYIWLHLYMTCRICQILPKWYKSESCRNRHILSISCCHYSAHLYEGQLTRSAHLGDICHYSAHTHQLLSLQCTFMGTIDKECTFGGHLSQCTYISVATITVHCTI